MLYKSESRGPCIKLVKTTPCAEQILYWLKIRNGVRSCRPQSQNRFWVLFSTQNQFHIWACAPSKRIETCQVPVLQLSGHTREPKVPLPCSATAVSMQSKALECLAVGAAEGECWLELELSPTFPLMAWILLM